MCGRLRKPASLITLLTPKSGEGEDGLVDYCPVGGSPGPGGGSVGQADLLDHHATPR